MKNKLKMLGVFLMLLLIIPQYGEGVSLDNGGKIKPMFKNINVFQATFDISSNGKSSSTVYLNASDVDKVEIKADLQQYKGGSWTTIKSWSSSKEGTNHDFTKDWYVTKGYSYRLVSYGYVYKGNKIVEGTSSTSEVIKY